MYLRLFLYVVAVEGTQQFCAGAHIISFFQGPFIEENSFGSEQHEDVVAEQQNDDSIFMFGK